VAQSADCHADLVFDVAQGPWQLALRQHLPTAFGKSARAVRAFAYKWAPCRQDWHAVAPVPLEVDVNWARNWPQVAQQLLCRASAYDITSCSVRHPPAKQHLNPANLAKVMPTP
jgi:hypothetical protein